ncbi:MAG: hypothetical protein HWN66_11240 [Candidatus Helarchaeota archaeon]|nr:hypothetical protein [Candidatus Helarchaeota archaeon]
MAEEDSNSNHNGINKILDLYQEALTKTSKLEDLDLINLFFHPLRATINEGRYDYKLIKAVYSATNLLDLKVQTLLDKTLQRKGFKKPLPLDSKETVLSTALSLSKSISPLARPLLPSNITKAYVELMIHRKKKRAYDSEPNRMSYDPVEIEPISIEEDKEKLLHKIRLLKKSSIELPKLLKEKTWEEVTRILNILLHLAHERKIKLYQEDFPTGKIIIIYEGGKN